MKMRGGVNGLREPYNLIMAKKMSQGLRPLAQICSDHPKETGKLIAEA
jgi:hypothetical protein